jgi:hypothetical protein
MWMLSAAPQLLSRFGGSAEFLAPNWPGFLSISVPYFVEATEDLEHDQRFNTQHLTVTEIQQAYS